MKTVETYIENASESTQPIIIHLRELIHSVSPDFKESIKWNAPNFGINEKNILSIMAFKKHVNFVFYQGKELSDTYGILENIGEKSNMKGIKKIEDKSKLPDDKILLELIHEAVALSKV